MHCELLISDLKTSATQADGILATEAEFVYVTGKWRPILSGELTAAFISGSEMRLSFQS